MNPLIAAASVIAASPTDKPAAITEAAAIKGFIKKNC